MHHSWTQLMSLNISVIILTIILPGICHVGKEDVIFGTCVVFCFFVHQVSVGLVAVSLRAAFMSFLWTGSALRAQIMGPTHLINDCGVWTHSGQWGQQTTKLYYVWIKASMLILHQRKKDWNYSSRGCHPLSSIQMWTVLVPLERKCRFRSRLMAWIHLLNSLNVCPSVIFPQCVFFFIIP